MTNRVRTHITMDNSTPSGLIPKHLTKQEFGRRLHSASVKKGWSQSELARRSGIARDAISTYIRGKSLPTPPNLAALAKALGVPAEELLPNHIEAAIDNDMPSFEMKVSPSAPSTAWVRVNRLVTLATAVKIAELLEGDNVLDRNGSSEAAKV